MAAKRGGQFNCNAEWTPVAISLPQLGRVACATLQCNIMQCGLSGGLTMLPALQIISRHK